MGICDGRVVIVTGAGGGIGRAHALAFATEGARVVVNDLGAARDGSGIAHAGAAQSVVDEIRSLGGDAVANTDDVSDWHGARLVVEQAIDTFGGLDVLVNNAGILRDRMLVNMAEAEWDDVVRVHLKGTFAPTRHAAQFWRGQAKSGSGVDARIINTTSPSGIFGNAGQANYGAAKAGIAAFTIITAGELARYGVTVNAVAPTALTRMTSDLASFHEWTQGDTDRIAPEHIAAPVVWLGSADSAGITGRVFWVWGPRIAVSEGWVNGPEVDRDRAWTPAELGEVLPELVATAAANADMTGSRTTKEV